MNAMTTMMARRRPNWSAKAPRQSGQKQQRILRSENVAHGLLGDNGRQNGGNHAEADEVDEDRRAAEQRAVFIRRMVIERRGGVLVRDSFEGLVLACVQVLACL